MYKKQKIWEKQVSHRWANRLSLSLHSLALRCNNNWRIEEVTRADVTKVKSKSTGSHSAGTIKPAYLVLLHKLSRKTSLVCSTDHYNLKVSLQMQIRSKQSLINPNFCINVFRGVVNFPQKINTQKSWNQSRS
jgi:hypothetical protein